MKRQHPEYKIFTNYIFDKGFNNQNITDLIQDNKNNLKMSIGYE